MVRGVQIESISRPSFSFPAQEPVLGQGGLGFLTETRQMLRFGLGSVQRDSRGFMSWCAKMSLAANGLVFPTCSL